MPGLKLQGIITPVSTGLREMLEKEGVIEGRVSVVFVWNFFVIHFSRTDSLDLVFAMNLMIRAWTMQKRNLRFFSNFNQNTVR